MGGRGTWEVVLCGEGRGGAEGQAGRARSDEVASGSAGFYISLDKRTPHANNTGVASSPNDQYAEFTAMYCQSTC